jgi:hypothetical protein
MDFGGLSWRFKGFGVGGRVEGYNERAKDLFGKE